LREVAGQDLSRLFAGGYKRRLVPDLVAPDPSSAIARIAARFGSTPTASGGNIEGMKAIRALIAACPGGHDLYAGLVITAPHTHWDSDVPLIVSRIGDRYRLSEAEAVAGETYRPVSFVFSPAGPLAYEWADSSVSMDPAELEVLWACVERLSGDLAAKAWPLGLSLNYRFKALLDPDLVSTSEFQEANTPFSPAFIKRSARFDVRRPQVVMEQVAWHAASAARSRLSVAETELLDRLQSALNQAEPRNRAKWIDDLQGSLSTQGSRQDRDPGSPG
jgi:hypothetical protein